MMPPRLVWKILPSGVVPCFLMWARRSLVRAKASVDVELVALGVLHPHRVVIEAVLAHDYGDRGPEIRQPPGLGVDSLGAGGERDRTAVDYRTAAADVDVEVEAVLGHLGLRHHMEPDAGAVTAGIDDAVRADSQLTVGKPDVAPPVVPGSEPFGGRLKHVPQGSRPEVGEQLGVLAVDDELESGGHRAPIGSAVARAPASMPRVKVGRSQSGRARPVDDPGAAYLQGTRGPFVYQTSPQQ